MEDALAPGITERELLGFYDERVAGLGAPHAAVGKRLLRNIPAGARDVPPPGIRSPRRRGRIRGARARRAVRRIRGRAGPHPRRRAFGQCGRRRISRRDVPAAWTRCSPRARGEYRRRPVSRVGGHRQPGIPGAAGPWPGSGRRAATDRPGSRTRCHARGGHGAERPVLGYRGGQSEGCLERATVHVENSGPTMLTRYGRL